MPRELKVHLVRLEEDQKDDQYLEKVKALSLCGIMTENMTNDVEAVSCKTCSGIYRTNVEWYSQVQNGALTSRTNTGSGDIYTRQDLFSGLLRLGWGMTAIREILDNTNIFRDVFLESETNPDPWASTPGPWNRT